MPEAWARGAVLVTGGTGLIGRAIGRAFLREGARVVLVGSTEARAREAATDGAEARAVDVSDEAAVERLFADLGPVGVLVNAAGVNFNRLLRDITVADFDRVMAVNLRSAFLCTRAACGGMVARGIRGRIVNITSGNFRYVRPGSALYSASKAGMDMLGRAFALEYGPHGINVNAVAPGLVDMPGVDDPQFRAIVAYYAERSPTRQVISAEDIADATLFLASSRAARMTGEVLVLDGGFSASRPDFPRRT